MPEVAHRDHLGRGTLGWGHEEDLLGTHDDVDGGPGRTPFAPDADAAEGAGDGPVGLDDPLDADGLAEEGSLPRAGRALVDLTRRADPGEEPVPHDGHLVGEGERLTLVVGDEHRRRAPLGEGRGDGLAGRGPQRRVEGGEGLVEEDDRGVERERPGEGDPLLLTAGELVRPAPGERGVEPDELEQLPHTAASTPARAVPAEGDVVPHVEVGEEAAVLADVADPASLRGQVHPGGGDDLVVEPHLAVAEVHEARNDAQQRRLAAARGAEHGGRRPGRHVEVDAAQDGGLAVGRGHAADVQGPHRRVPLWRRSRIVSGADRRIIIAAYGAAPT